MTIPEVAAGYITTWLLFACLNSPVVKRQIRSKRFTQDIIDTLGNRILEILIPIQKDEQKRQEIESNTREIIEGRVALRNRAREVALNVEGLQLPQLEDEELLDLL